MQRQLIKNIIVNDTRYICNGNGIFIRPGTRQRQPRQFRGVTEGAYEQQHDDFIKNSGFQYEQSIPFEWIKNVFQRNPKINELRSIATCLSHFMSLQLNRYDYRKRPQLWYWMNEHMEKIFEYVQQNRVEIEFNEGNIIQLSSDCLAEIIGNHVTVVQDSVIVTSSPDTNFDDQYFLQNELPPTTEEPNQYDDFQDVLFQSGDYNLTSQDYF